MSKVRWHVVPIGDHEPHVVSENCHCHPLNNGEIIAHNAFDLRDAMERTHGATGKQWITIGEEV